MYNKYKQQNTNQLLKKLQKIKETEDKIKKELKRRADLGEELELPRDAKKKSIKTGEIESSSNEKVQNATEKSNGSEESYKEHSSEEDSSDGEFCVYYTIDDNKKGDYCYASDPRKRIDPKEIYNASNTSKNN